MSEITKIQVASGIYWIEIPEARLRVLCSCPADSVKHLMKRGLIVTKKEKGITFETGPNAILLSDVLLQNGSFANLAEFPVLQMLYLQGMIIPNHPNNTGAKPMLIGSESQVRAQMQYIFRGNYGLSSEEEHIIAGASPEKAAEMVRMKLKFSFGTIRETDELLDSTFVGNQFTEIKNSVFVRRIRLNVFEFQYRGESVTVDLNLPPHLKYESPYPLGFQNIKREYFGVIHSGNGDGWDVTQPEMAGILMFQGKIYLIDVGPNIIHSLTALGIGANEIRGIFHTHAHDDHFAGLATLMRSDHRIKYYSTPLVRASVAKKLSALVSMDEEDFSHYFDPYDLREGAWNEIDGLEVRPVFSPHPVETTIMIFRATGENGTRTYAHLADIISLDVLKNMITEDETGPGVSRQLYDRVSADYLEKADLKKIDIGGGMIHGNAEDFREDISDKIILSHTSLKLTDRQKEVGSGAPFGMVDVMIPGYQDYVRMYAYYFLHNYFPSVPSSQLRMLMNDPLVTFNPESILLKTGTVNQYIYLILTGEVEMIRTASGVHNMLSAGGLIGEICALTGSPSTETYRAANFVHALQIPGHLYLEFVKHNGLYAEIQRLRKRREFLQMTWLFGELISYPIQNTIAKSMQMHVYHKGQEIPTDNIRRIFLVHTGKVQLVLGSDIIETLHHGDFFGEGLVLFNTPCVYTPRIEDDVEIYYIPADVLLDIPVVRWKLFETFKKRVELVHNPEIISTPVFTWRDEYNINIRDMDAEHIELFRMANRLYEAICNGENKTSLEVLLGSLIDRAENHFRAEEALLKDQGYPEYTVHRKKHEHLLNDILDVQRKFQDNEMELGMDFIYFLKDWTINHIITDDMQYGRFLHQNRSFK